MAVCHLFGLMNDAHLQVQSAAKSNASAGRDDRRGKSELNQPHTGK